MMLNYDYPLYRPPSEADSLIFQVTLGCSFNECSFCDMYRSKQYSERSWDEVKAEIDMMAKMLPDTKRIFLADGDALNLSVEYMQKIVKYLREKFQNLERISCYAMPMNVLKKTPEELKLLRESGLDMFYLGIETGSDLILKKVTKGATSVTMIRAIKKAMDAGYIMSCMIILGLGGKTHSKEHIRGTAEVINATAPHYVGALTLYLENGIKDEFMTKFGEPFIPVSDHDALDELEDLISQIDVKNNVIFRANHGSNAYTIKGTFPQDKQMMQEKISWMKQHPEVIRPVGLRGF
ncbi:MAG: radical SAM protein [Nitrosopumilaceae archaeon]|nr:radical SAM protein [Nitrososphaeria archaeon]NDB50941.1 radical SAM protein [Nitrosopumilaceae archaeon]NDB88014.1 radical SAM protein [Nitrososphaerota archaeon]NDB91994.1 radical SAM protein [Nitrososphaeria archaeon]NDF26354.1 radical SAM protein [Nitrosopumilaceae archaeon]